MSSYPMSSLTHYPYEKRSNPDPWQAPEISQATSSCSASVESGLPRGALTRPSRRPKRRFGRSLLVAAALVSVGVVGLLGKKTYRLSVSKPQPQKVNFENYEADIPSTAHLLHCSELRDWSFAASNASRVYPYTASALYTFPLDSDSLFFLSRGNLSAGQFTLKTDSELKGDQVQVTISARYRSERDRDLGKVCEVNRAGEGRGLGIFTPHLKTDLPWTAQLAFRIDITLPSISSQRVIKKLETDMPMMSQVIQDLPNYTIDTVNLQSFFSLIHVNALSFNTATINTTYGSVIGTFNTTNLLSINSESGAVNIRVGALASALTTPKIEILTINSNIQAELSLTSDTGSGGDFHVSTLTTHGRLSVKFGAQPVDSTLHFNAASETGSVSVTLDPAFQGKFNVHGKQTMPLVHINPDVSDPSGENKERRLSISTISDDRMVYGSSFWSENREIEGNVDVIGGAEYSPPILKI